MRELARIRLQKTAVPEYQQLQMDTFRVISDWYHFGILELTYLKSFKSDPRWIAKALGITEIEAVLFRPRGGGPNNIAAMDKLGGPEPLWLQPIPAKAHPAM